MNIYIVNVLLTVIWGCVLLLYKPNKKKKIAFCTLVSVQWVLISGLRGMSVSPDMVSYQNKFNMALRTPWSKVFNSFYDVYINEEGKDPGYLVFEKIVQIFTKDYQTFLFIVAVFFFTLMAIWIYKNSSLPCFSFLVFDAYLFSFYAITGTRQTIATALVVFIGTSLIQKKKFIPFLIICLIAFTIHKSSMVFVLFYFVSKLQINRKYMALVACAFPILFIFRNQYVNVLRYISGYDYDALESTGAYGFTALYLAVTIASCVLFKYVKKNSRDYKMYYNALFLGLIFIPAVFVNPAMMRVVQYFSIYILLMIPELIKSFEKRMRIPIYIIVIGLLFAVSNVYHYSYTFFWQ